MSKKRILHLLPIFALVATFIVTACQPIRSQTASPASGEQDIASREELKAKIIAMEFATFDHLRQHDVAAVDAEISADYLWIDATGIKGRADYLAVVADEKLQFGEPERGAVEVRILSPTAVLVMYPMTTHGSYDGEEFTGHEYLSSLWMKRAGKWQNVFLQSSPQEEQESPPAAATVDEQIQNAMSAAPLAIAKDATILDYPAIEGGDMVVLREGTNDWTCFTDWPVTPGNDPACYDAVWMALNDALAAGVEPAITSPGLGYMLAGGSDPSNTDPMAMAPAAGEDWITTPAHLMLLVPGGFDATQFTTDHTSGQPFIMWDGTPYEHLMIPVNRDALEMGHSNHQAQTAVPANQQTEADQALATQIDALMTNLQEEGTFNGAVLIAHNGQVLLRKGYGLADREQNLPNTPTTRFRLASLTKQFTAMAILLLQEQGKLHVDDPVCQYIPDCPAAWQGMTIHHLLTHTAGVYDLRDFIYTGQTPPAPSTSAQVIERIKAQPLAFAPGEGSSYTNGGFMVAGYIVEQVSGQSYAQFLQEYIFAPLGMKNTGYVDDTSGLAVGYRNATTPENPLDSSLPFAAAGLYSTVDDLYLYAQALDSGQLLSPPALETFFNQHVQFGADNGGFSPGYEAPVAYAYGWGVATFHGHRVIGHDGWIEGYGGDLRRYPDDHITTILLMNQSEPYAALIGDQIAAALFATQ